jgi:peptidoglycan/xylan/chitin deacetylase (PgdA/CDA1 family)
MRVGPLICLAGILGLAAPATAADCPGHPDALGTSRTLVVDPTEHPRIGSMQYHETLPLEDHEVVLTFDDGPLPPYANRVLQTLASQCVKATYFIIGQQAHEHPEIVREIHAAGHTIGTHSQNHPLRFERMPIEKVKAEVEDGIASVTAALGDPSEVAPFFRIPGLLRADGVESYLASKSLMTWSADLVADDWRHLSAGEVLHRALTRLEARGKGVLLLHDIQPSTALMLPKLLRELKRRGYRIVQVVPATAEQPATPTDPGDWQLYPPSESVPIAHWPKVPSFSFAETESLIAPAVSDVDSPDGKLLLSGQPIARVKRGVPLPLEAPWPQVGELPVQTAAVLAVPAQSLFEMPDEHAAFRSSPPPRVAATEESEERGKGRRGRGGRTKVAHGAHGAAKHHAHASGGGKKPVHVASLKKRRS